MWRVSAQADPEAFASLVRRWEPPIQRLCIRMTGSFTSGEDIAQETFARLFSRRQTYRPTGRFSTWLWRIALNLCHDHLRQQWRRNETSLDAREDEEPRSQPEPAADEPSPDRQLESLERGKLVRDALQLVAEHYRSVLILKHYEGLKFREIADILAIPEGTAKSRMAEGLTQLAGCLARAVQPPARSHEQLKELLML